MEPCIEHFCSILIKSILVTKHRYPEFTLLSNYKSFPPDSSSTCSSAPDKASMQMFSTGLIFPAKSFEAARSDNDSRLCTPRANDNLLPPSLSSGARVNRNLITSLRLILRERKTRRAGPSAGITIACISSFHLEGAPGALLSVDSTPIRLCLLWPSSLSARSSPISSRMEG